jgi:hypothetical protein
MGRSDRRVAVWAMVPYEYVRAALRSPVGGGMLTGRPSGFVMIGAACYRNCIASHA